MRELRLGDEAHIDISKYADENMTWQDMQNVRKQLTTISKLKSSESEQETQTEEELEI